MKKYILLLFLFIVGTLIPVQAQNNVCFFEEHIDFKLDANYFTINGIYSFHNNEEKEVNQQIILPFADKTISIDSIRIINLSTGRKIKFNRLENSVLFNFSLVPKDTVDVNIFYRQRISTINKYVITSTQTWGKPLKIAIYTLTTDNNTRIKSFSYFPDSISEVNNKKLYIWERYDFMPKFDFEITIDK